MREVAEYRRYADTCRKLSLDMAEPDAKRQLMEMATVWTLLADERENALNGRASDLRQPSHRQPSHRVRR